MLKSEYKKAVNKLKKLTITKNNCKKIKLSKLFLKIIFLEKKKFRDWKIIKIEKKMLKIKEK